MPAPMAHVPPGGPRGWGLSVAPRHGPSKTELQDKEEGVTPHPNPHHFPAPFLPTLPLGAQLGMPQTPILSQQWELPWDSRAKHTSKPEPLPGMCQGLSELES